MPRNVRPVWIALHIDGRATELAAGPRTRAGWMSGAITLRTLAGAVSDPIRIAAGGDPARLEIDVPAGWTIDTHTTTTGPYRGRRSLTIRPPDAD